MEAEDRVLKDFISILDELTFNSRPIITSLTKMTEENISYAQKFVDAIETRISKCVPNQKLFSFYALDSICKNAGSPYTIYFGRNLAKLYRQAYLIVDNVTRTKFISMFKTWMTPLPTGELLFDSDVLERIEQFLIKASSLHQKQAQALVPSPTVPVLLREIDKLTVLTRERISKTSLDSKLQTKVIILNQLKQELQREKLPIQALHQVQQQLKQIFAQEQQILWQQQQQQQQEFPNPPKLRLQLQAPIQQQILDNNGSPPLAQSYGGSSLFGNATLSMSFLDSVSSKNGSSGFQATAKRVSKVESLYKALKNKNLLYEPSNQSIVALCSKLEKKMNSNNTIRLPPFSLLQDILGNVKSYYATRNLDILNTPNLQLSQHFVMQAHNPFTDQLMQLLYRAKPIKCTTCGIRFKNIPEEHQLEIDHYDWHFRVNKRMKGTQGSNNMISKNIQSRMWYLSDDQWIHFKDEDIVSTDVDLASANSISLALSRSAVSAESGNNAKIELEIQKKYVIVPDGASDMSFQCSICTEVTSAVYDEDLSEWVWKNCFESNGKYFHATCFHEASISNECKNSGSTGIDSDLKRLKVLINSSSGNVE